MPKIKLKPRSPEFADEHDNGGPSARGCEMPGCVEKADHKAPKDRSLSEYYWFCFEHVVAYNKTWDYFSGMSQKDIEDHLIRSALWDRPTRRFDNYAKMEEHLRTTAWQSYHFTDKKPDFENATSSDKSRFSGSDEQSRDDYSMNISADAPEFEAMAIMGLSPPLDMTAVKKKYKELAKKYHPDVNKGCPRSEELLKRINMAYTILKLAHGKFAKLPERHT